MMGIVEAGGHNGFDTQAEETGFDYLVQEQKKTLQNKGYKSDDIQQEAIFLSIPIYEKRHAMNEAYWNSELQRETEVVTSYEIRYNEERKQYEMYHPGYETYLQDMLARTERYAKEKNQPQVFNKEESDSIIQAERALISGEATSILYPVWHESGKVRYITEMTIDGSSVKNRYVDIGKIAGKDLSREDAVQMLQDFRNLHDGKIEKRDDHAQCSRLVLKEREIGFKEISMTTYNKFHDGKEEKRKESWMHPTHMVKNADYEGKSYLWDGIIGERGLLGTLQIAERLYKEKFIPFMQHKREEKTDNGKTNKKERRVKNFQEDVHPLVSRIEKQKAKFDEKKKAVFIAQQTGIGIGGALVMLDGLKEPIKPITKKEKRELRKMKKETKMARQKKTRLDLPRIASSETDSSSRVSKRESRQTKRQRYKETKKLSQKEMKKQKNKETLHIIFSMEKKKRKQPKQEKKLIIASKEKRNKILFNKHERELKLHTVLEKITRKIRKEVIYAKGKQERKIIRPKESVQRLILEFTRAWILFMLLRPSFFEKQQHEKKENVLFIRKNNKEEKTIHEFSPWILLSIIWYLATIREQGKAVIIPKKKKKKNRRGKKKRKLLRTRYSQRISQHGIIYAYLF